MSVNTQSEEDTLTERLRSIEPLVRQVCQSMQNEAQKIGFSTDEFHVADPAQASYRLERDPADGSYTVAGEWRNARGEKSGLLRFHADGSFFVEYDVIRDHPTNNRWFVEAMNAWGKDSLIRCEARCLPSLG